MDNSCTGTARVERRNKHASEAERGPEAFLCEEHVGTWSNRMRRRMLSMDTGHTANYLPVNHQCIVRYAVHINEGIFQLDYL